MPALPVPPFVVVQADFFFELMVVLLDLPPAMDQPHQPPQRVLSGKIAQAVFGGGLLRLRPLNQQPNGLARRPAVLIAMRGLDSCRPEAGFQPSLAAFPPADLFPALGLSGSLLRHYGALTAVAGCRGWPAPVFGLVHNDLRRLQPDSHLRRHADGVGQSALFKFFTKLSPV